MRLYRPWSLLLTLLCVTLGVDAIKNTFGNLLRTTDGDPSVSSGTGRRSSAETRLPDEHHCSPGVYSSMTQVDTKFNGFCRAYDPKVDMNDGYFLVACGSGKLRCTTFNDPCIFKKKKGILRFLREQVADCSASKDQVMRDPDGVAPAIIVGNGKIKAVPNFQS